MNEQKTFNQRTCALLVIALLLFELAVGIFGIRVSAVSNVQSYDDTPIESDMANMEEAEYPANPLGECSIVGFMEYCYSENSAYSSLDVP